MPRAPKKAADAADSQTVDERPRLAEFESSVTELETLVERLEAGDITLEDALAHFERGVTLSRQCQALLAQAELRVDQLMAGPDGSLKAKAFEPSDQT